MSTPPILIDGPISAEDGSLTGPTTPLYFSEESTVTTETDTQPQDIPTQDSEDTLLAPIAGQQSIRASGTIQGSFLRRNREFLPRYSDEELFDEDGINYTPENAYRLYAFLLESLVMPEQGQGYRVGDTIRNEVFEPSSESFGVIFDNVTHEYTSGEGFRGSWSLSGQVADGVQNTTNRKKYIDSQKDKVTKFDKEFTTIQTASTLIELGEVTKMRRERDIDLNVSDLIHQQEKKDAVNIAAAESGVKESVNVEGRIADQQTSKSLETVASEIELDIHGERAILFDSITARANPCAVSDSSSTFVSGNPNVVEYRIEVDIGNAPSTTELNAPSNEEETTEEEEGFFEEIFDDLFNL
jgi:hypothetical protein